MSWPHCLISVDQNGSGRMNEGCDFVTGVWQVQDAVIKLRYRKKMMEMRGRERKGRTGNEGRLEEKQNR